MALSPLHRLGVVGKALGHSFSPGYFQRTHLRRAVDVAYDAWEFPDAKAIATLRKIPGLRGFNVTVPYKEAIVPLLDELAGVANALQAVNTVVVEPDGRWVGYNTDVIGFRQSVQPWLGDALPKGALVLGTGGAAKAVRYVLVKILGSDAVRCVSRRPATGQISYAEVTAEVLAAFPLVVNTTPLGMHPNVDEKPNLPYGSLGPANLLFDLVYNPPVTAFLKAGRENGARTQNGQQMLEGQAEAAWELWCAAWPALRPSG